MHEPDTWKTINGRRSKIKKRRCGQQPIIHRYKKAKAHLEWMIETGTHYKKFEGFDLSDLTIVTIHNYEEKSLFEQSLDFMGIKDYIVIKHEGEWEHMIKLQLLLKFIKDGKCATKYLLLCDARDTVFADDPRKIVPIFISFDCDLLFNSTMSAKGCYRTEEGKDLHKWAIQIGRKGCRYLNAGCFIGRPKFMKKVLEVAVDFTDKVKASPTPNQDALRPIQPLFHPRMDVDYNNKLFYRN